MTPYFFLITLLTFLPIAIQSQTIQDDFEGNGNVTNWYGDDCGININLANPFRQGINNSATVLEYEDTGGQYANVRFEVADNFDLSTNYIFTLKVYVPSNGLTGNQANQVSLKLQDGTLPEPWSTQTEIIKAIALDQWQTVTFNFVNDAYINLDAGSAPPRYRTDFSRVVIQVNGENNADAVLAYLDDFYYDGNIPTDPVFDNLVWSDEFDGNGAIDDTKWFHQTQLPAAGGWHNGERQHYTNRIDNSYVENGLLKIVAQKETFTDQGYTKSYTSARLNSKFAFQYGRVEIRAKLPSGGGTWPALWTLGKNITEDGAYWETQGFGTTPWPACGEIDMMEHWGNNQNYVQSAIHTPSSFGGTINLGGRVVSTASSDFHVYAMEWTPEKLVFSIDDMIHYIYNPSIKDANTWPFDAEQYLLLNVAIEQNVDPNFTQSEMEVDYVRVYQESTVATRPIDRGQDLLFYPNPIAKGTPMYLVLDNDFYGKVKIELMSLDGRVLEVLEKEKTDSRQVFEITELPVVHTFLLRVSDRRNSVVRMVVQF